MTHKKKIGFFGGSFNPIHFGHIHLALEAKERFSLDEIIFSPSHSPFKSLSATTIKNEHRLKMLILALEDLPDFSISDFEIFSCGPTYTIDTLNHLAALNKEAKLHLILGYDQIEKFPKWKSCQEIISNFSPIVGNRSGVCDQESLLKIGIRNFFNTTLLEISSSMLRERLSKRAYSKHLMPAKVVDYIHEHGLYLMD